MIENYEQVRERIARWVWPQYNESSQKMFNPHNNPADAWLLQCALYYRGYSVQIRPIEPDSPEGFYECGIYGIRMVIVQSGATPAEALVRAWMEAFPDDNF